MGSHTLIKFIPEGKNEIFYWFNKTKYVWGGGKQFGKLLCSGQVYYPIVIDYCRP
jgi:hypothetical protein